MLEDEAFLKKFHHALLEVHLEEGSLVCPETGRHLKRGQPRDGSGFWWFKWPNPVVGAAATRGCLFSRSGEKADAVPGGGCLSMECGDHSPPSNRHCVDRAPAGRKFPVSDGIPNMLLTEDEC